VERHLDVRRGARYFLYGEPDGPWSELWTVLHGYGQLARDFALACACLASPDRLVLAPEGLSRFYSRGGSGAVGASWMTSEDREAEIDDTLGYLSAVVEAVRGDRQRSRAVSLLGFSQGAAAAARFAVLGPVRPKHLVLWGAGLPPDLPAERVRASLRDVDVVLVAGRSDPYLGIERFAAERARLEAVAPHARIERFDGAHHIDPRVLETLA